MMNDKELYEEVLWLVGSIKDPQKRECSLEDLGVINKDSVSILHITNHSQPQPKHDAYAEKNGLNSKLIEIKLMPTNVHCHLIQQIALAVHLRLKRQLSSFQAYKLRVICFPHSHAKQQEVQKQMNDKERIAAALENLQIVHYLNELLD